MLNKKAFDVTGGYPEDHGFDTQGFAWKFLMSGLIAYTCPEASYLQRINFNQSYYLREYFSGRINLNWIKILSEFFPVFTDEVIQKIVGFDIDSNKNIMAELYYSDQIFIKDYTYKKNDILVLENKKQLTLGEYYWVLFNKLKKNNLDKLFFESKNDYPAPKCIVYDEKSNKFIFKKAKKITLGLRTYRKIIGIINKLTNN